jgi:hypothetical protein
LCQGTAAWVVGTLSTSEATSRWMTASLRLNNELLLPAHGPICRRYIHLDRISIHPKLGYRKDTDDVSHHVYTKVTAFA